MKYRRQSQWIPPADAQQRNGAADRTAHVSRRGFLGTGAVAVAGLSLGVAGPAYAASTSSGNSSSAVPFGPVIVENAGGASGDYARAVRLSGQQPGTSRTLLVTFPQSGFPIFRSDDDGRTWHQQGNVIQTGGGFWLQPVLYELPRAFAGLPKGALLCAGNEFEFGTSLTTNIQLYGSTDQGVTWRFLSTVAVGGAPVPGKTGSTQVFEPFLLLHRDRLICYYSDERDPKYSQKISHQTSTDLVHWGPVVTDSVGTDSAQRPGMATVAQVHHSMWIMTHEAGGGAGDNFYAVHYKMARDPEAFGPAAEQILHDQSGYIPSASPTVSWSDSGDPAGVIVVSANSNKDFFINRASGDPDAWTRLSSAMPRGYSRFTVPLASPGSWRRPGLVFVVTGPPYGDQGPIQAGVIQLD